MDLLLAYGKALSDPTRVRIINALLQSELCVCELVDALQVSQSSLSSHLQLLKSNGILKAEKRQTWIIYSITIRFAWPLKAAFSSLPTNDERIEIDNLRLSRRLRLRVDGCCVQGAGALEGEEEALAQS